MHWAQCLPGRESRILYITGSVTWGTTKETDINNWTGWVNSLKSDDIYIYICIWINWLTIGPGNGLCHLFSAKPLPEPSLTYCQLYHLEQTSEKFDSKYNNFLSRTWTWQCQLQNGGHFVWPWCVKKAHNLSIFNIKNSHCCGPVYDYIFFYAYLSLLQCRKSGHCTCALK